MSMSPRSWMQAREDGMSLIEVLSSMVVLSLGILGLAPMMALSVQGSTQAQDVTSVVVAAQQRIEDLIGQTSFASLPYSSTDNFNGGKYVATTAVTDNSVDSSVPDHVYRIDVTVDWTDDKGVDRTMTFTTFSPKL